ncbi:chaperone-modulator protein CbpM [Salmonella enterica subsp. enterica serovar Choleraesuis]|nr:chaperone-modulator protein CbpM [Salmonella enterica subsp. enterica serovar Choleraesuis]
MMSKVTVTFTITEFCLYSGIQEDELMEIVGLGVIEPHDREQQPWQFDDLALSVAHRAQRLRRELALDWPGIAVTLSLLEENERLNRENRVLQQQLARFIKR